MTIGSDPSSRYYKAAADMTGARVAAGAFGAASEDPALELPKPVTDAYAKVFELGAGRGQDNRDALAVGALMGHETASVNLGNAAANAIAEAKAQAEEKAKKEHEDRMFQILLDRARALSEELGRKIKDHEEAFARNHGDAWREKFANELLEPDLVPQRKDGESLHDYRARVEKALVDELLDEQGNIKDKYKNDPRYADLAIWAKSKFDKHYVDQKIERMTDPSLPEEVRQKEAKELAEKGTLQQHASAYVTLHDKGLVNQQLERGTDKKIDESLSKTKITAAAAAAAFD